MSESGPKPKYAEASLSRTAKLVLIRSTGDTFVRLRKLDGETWRFITPPLPIAKDELDGLLTSTTGLSGITIHLQHPEMDGKLAMMRYQGQIITHFQGTQASTAASTFEKAVRQIGD